MIFSHGTYFEFHIELIILQYIITTKLNINDNIVSYLRYFCKFYDIDLCPVKFLQ
jgi:hypothetical protein